MRSPATVRRAGAALVAALAIASCRSGGKTPADPPADAATAQEAPAAPAGLELAVVGYDAVALRWEPSEGASAYRVQRDGTPVGRSAEPRWLDLRAPLLVRSAHEYSVTAVGPGGAESAPSSPIATTVEFPRESVPEPVFDERPEFVYLYYAAWADAWSRVRADGESARVDFGRDASAADAWLLADLAAVSAPVLPVTPLLDALFASDADDDAPGALAAAEWALFSATGDVERLRRVREPLERRFARARERGLERTSVAFASEQAIAADALARIALALADEPAHRAWTEARREIRDRLNEAHWDAADQAYHDLAPDGSRLAATSLDAFRPLAAGVPDRTRAAALVYHLEDPARFHRPHRFPSVAASEASPAAVETYANALLVRGLAAYGYDELAREVTSEHLLRVARVRAATGGFFDAYDPESTAPARSARPAPAAAAVGGLLRHVIGIAADAPSEMLYFRVSSVARHGVMRLRVGRRVASIVCEARRSEADPCDVTIECDGPIGVVVAAPWAEFPMPRVEAGSHKFRLMRPPGSNP